jgi:hypothetical protein
MMRHLTSIAVLLAVIVPLTAAPFLAPAQNRPGTKSGACFNTKEAEAEAEVRTGIQVREVLRRCAQSDPQGQAYLDDWYAFDQENTERLRGAVDLRRQALSRIYPNRQQAMQWETDAAVATVKALQTNEAVCKSTYDMIDRIKKEKWPGFKYYAKLQSNLLANELPICRR